MADHEDEQTPEDKPVTEEPTVDEPAAAEVGEPEAAEPEAASPAAPAAKPRRRAKPKAAEEPKRKKAPARKKPAERKPIVRLPKPEHARGRRKERRGVVVSSAMDKTIVVRVDIAKPHPKYRKVVRRSQKLHAHDELNVAKAGDVVRLVETRPISALKRWRLAEVLEEAK
jgi:small subunit ribosomal protein S17